MSKKAFRPDVDAPEWRGRYSPYDIIKEGTIAIVLVGLLTILLATFFGSPDERAITMRTWSNADPVWLDAGIFPILSEGALRATLGILARTVQA